MSNHNNTSNAKTVLEGLVGRMASGDLPAAIAKSYIHVDDDMPSSKWSRFNRILMMMSGTSDARGYRQWGEVGRHVRKGSRAVYILAPRMVKVADKDDKEKEEREVMVGFRALPVFRYEDTEGKAIKSYEPKSMPPLFELADMNGIDVRYMNTSHGEYGCIGVESGHMTLSSEDPDVYLHELVHWYDLKDRDDRKNGQDEIQETVAQLGACALAHMYGIDVSAWTARYIASYAGCSEKDGDKLGRQCMRVIDRVCGVIDRIMEDAARVSGVDKSAREAPAIRVSS